MNVFCNQCGMCCKLIPVNNDGSFLLRDGFKLLNNDEKNLESITIDNAIKINENYVKEIQTLFPDATFYSCKFVARDGHCMSPEKFDFCKQFPETDLAIVPNECQFIGEVFIKKEALKHKIRVIKEEILDYETLIQLGDKDSKSYEKIIENLKKFIKKYRDFGSDNW